MTLVDNCGPDATRSDAMRWDALGLGLAEIGLHAELILLRGEMAAVSTCVLAVGERLYYSRWKRLVFATTGRDRQCYVTIII